MKEQFLFLKNKIIMGCDTMERLNKKNCTAITLYKCEIIGGKTQEAVLSTKPASLYSVFQFILISVCVYIYTVHLNQYNKTRSGIKQKADRRS